MWFSIGLPLTVTDFSIFRVKVSCIASDAYLLHCITMISICRVHFTSLSDFTDMCCNWHYNVTHLGIFKSRNDSIIHYYDNFLSFFLLKKTYICMVTFKGHEVTSLSCRESRFAEQSTFHSRFFLSERFCYFILTLNFSHRV